jgi:cell division protein FtsW
MNEKIRSFDHTLFFVVVALMGIGLIMVYSASSIASMTEMSDSLFYFKKQLMWVLIGLFALFILSYIPYTTWESLAIPLLVVSVLLLILVLIPGVTREIGGAKRWLRFGGFGFQPSEFAKIAFVIYLAHAFSTKQQKIQDFVRGILPEMIIMGIVFALILKGPNLSTAAIIGSVFFILLFLGNGSLLHLMFMGACGSTLVVSLIFQESYRMRRFLAFLDPWATAKTSGYHIIQSLIAIGSGGMWGLGLGQSRQKFFILPERHTDFIFAIICEELGLLGGALIVILFFLLIWRGFYIAAKAPDMFGFLLAAGVTSIIALQTLINLGVVLSLLPTTGVTLPFVSYGGSSLVFLAGAMGILLNISRYSSGKNAFEEGGKKTFAQNYLDPGDQVYQRRSR